VRNTVVINGLVIRFGYYITCHRYWDAVSLLLARHFSQNVETNFGARLFSYLVGIGGFAVG
jgi:hypothetical protein